MPTTRCAVGDTGKAQRLIKTVPRKGIRFGGPLKSGPALTHPARAASGSAFTRPSTKAGLMGSVDCSCPLLLIRHRVSARYSDHKCAFGRSCYEVHGVRCSHQLISGSSDPAYQGAACMDDRAGGMGLIFRTADWQTPICDADIQPHIQPARHTRLGCRNLAHCRRYRLRVAPCGTRPCSR
jgi:hypothetical protein